MKIKIDGRLEGIDKPTIERPETGQPLTFRDVFLSSLLIPVEKDEHKQKMEKWELYKKLKAVPHPIVSGTEVVYADADLTPEDIVLLKKCLEKFQPQLIYGQCIELLDV